MNVMNMHINFITTKYHNIMFGKTNDGNEERNIGIQLVGCNISALLEEIVFILEFYFAM